MSDEELWAGFDVDSEMSLSSQSSVEMVKEKTHIYVPTEKVLRGYL